MIGSGELGRPLLVTIGPMAGTIGLAGAWADGRKAALQVVVDGVGGEADRNRLQRI